jgi:hypothetical protein
MGWTMFALLFAPLRVFEGKWEGAASRGTCQGSLDTGVHTPGLCA